MLAYHLNNQECCCPNDVRWEADGEWVRQTGRWARDHHWLRWQAIDLSYQVEPAVAEAAVAFRSNLLRAEFKRYRTLGC